MNVTLNIEIKTHLSLSEKIEFMGVLKEQLAEHLVDAELKTTLVKQGIPISASPQACFETNSPEAPTKLEKTINLKLSVPIEHDECGRRKSPTCYIAKYLDKWIQNLTPNYRCNLPDARFPEKTIDLATLPIKKYNEKYKTEVPITFFPGAIYQGILIKEKPKT